MMDYVPLIQSSIAAIAVLSAAGLGLGIYRRQKNLDRKQEEYRSYVMAFEEANFWTPRNEEKRVEAEARYHQARVGLLLVASADVIDAVSGFHSSYVSQPPVQEKRDELFRKFAAMIAAMRKDGFDRAITTPEEVEKRIPWEV